MKRGTMIFMVVLIVAMFVAGIVLGNSPYNTQTRAQYKQMVSEGKK